MKNREVMRVRAEVKTTARVLPEISSKDVPEQVMASTLFEIDKNQVNEDISAIPDFVFTRSFIQRAKMEGRPPVPASLSEMQIDGEWTKISSGERFLLFQTCGSGRIAAFATDLTLERLCESLLVIMDSTFRVSPLLFSQLYTLHG